MSRSMCRQHQSISLRLHCITRYDIFSLSLSLFLLMKLTLERREEREKTYRIIDRLGNQVTCKGRGKERNDLQQSQALHTRGLEKQRLGATGKNSINGK